MIYFDDERLSKTGKKIPINDADDEAHDCPNNPYKKGVFKDMKQANTTYRERVPQADNTTLIETIARVGKLELAVDQVNQNLKNLEQSIEQFGEALAKVSFQKGTGEGL